MSVSWHQQVKDGNRETLINKGRELFIKKKFNNVSLKEICAAAGLSKVTFYKSFTSIDELVFAIQEGIFRDFDDYLRKNVSREGRGIDDLKSYLMALMKFSVEMPGSIQFIGYFDYIYRDDISDVSLRVNYKKLLKQSFFVNFLHECIDKGLSDGSIILKHSISASVAFIIEIFMSMIQRVTIKGHYLVQE
ncbi:TetR/AcrR family transcriptional regulator, partial [Klebsiella pneumoniae]|nr:TetR/AcrR family transcriptional regulator [Klebsiella pneumoniae]